MELIQTKEAAKEFIENGGPCVEQYGLWNNGGKPISKEKALSMLDKYSFDLGFYMLNWIIMNDQTTLQFKELSECDLF